MLGKKTVAAVISLVILAIGIGYALWYRSSISSTVLHETDDLGRSVTIKEAPKRIVSMAPSVTEILFALGVGNKVVGVTDACDYPPEALDITKIREPYGDYQIEKIVELKPDLVVMDRYLDLTPSGKWLSKLEEIGQTTVVLYAKTFYDIQNDIMLVGRATFSEENATKLVNTLNSRINAVVEKVKNLTDDEKPRVFGTGWYDGESDPWTSGYGTFANDVIERAGGRNIASAKGGFFQMDLEAIIWANPQIVVSLEDSRWPTPTYNALLGDERLREVDALKNNAVYKIDASLLSRPGPRLVDGLEEMAKILHPELFA